MSGDRWWLRLRYGLVRFDGGRPDDYDTILSKLKQFVGDGKSPNFAKLLIDLAHGKNLTKDTLATEYRLTTINEGERERALDLFRRVFFLCLVREQGAWQSAVYIDGSDPYKAGLCVSFARALLLMRDGHLKLDDVFGNNAMYNPYTVKGMFKMWYSVLLRCKRIDDKFVEHNEGVQLTAEQAHKDLRAVYGGESDTDGEDYD